jgi:ribosomal protein S18 acetylase RimI-like enzyme
MIRRKKDKMSRIKISDGVSVAGFLDYYYPKDHGYKRNVNIHWIEVRVKYRRKGLATKLLTTLINYVKKEGIVWISLWTGYDMEKDNAMELFRKMGFIEGTYQPDYYEPGVGTRLFVKRIDKDNEV